MLRIFLWRCSRVMGTNTAEVIESCLIRKFLNHRGRPLLHRLDGSLSGPRGPPVTPENTIILLIRTYLHGYMDQPGLLIGLSFSLIEDMCGGMRYRCSMSGPPATRLGVIGERYLLQQLYRVHSWLITEEMNDRFVLINLKRKV